MFRKSAALITGIMLMLGLTLGISAQTDTALVPTTLEDLTADPAPYVGQTVILEGHVTEFINVQSFVLGEGVAIDDDQVLVVNTSGQPLPVNVFRDDRVIVTGVVHASLQMRLDNNEVVLPEDRVAFRRGWRYDGGLNADLPVVPMTEATEEVLTDEMTMPDGGIDTSWESYDFYYAGGFPDGYDGHLIIEVTSIQDIMHNIAE